MIAVADTRFITSSVAVARRPVALVDLRDIMVFAVLFPGQGSQMKGMGADLFDRYPGLTRFACDLLGYDLVALCQDNPASRLSRTEYTQPALYTVNALRMFERVHREERGADFLLGHSLGEYNALLTAGAFDFETGLKLVKKRGELMAAASGGGMTAVMDVPEIRLLEMFREDGIEGIDLAGFNTPTQVVIAGTTVELQAAHAALEHRKVRFAPLDVSAPFHSRYMAPAREEFERHLRQFTFSEPSVPVIANVTGRPYEQGSIVQMLCDQLVEPVRWVDSIRHLLAIDGLMECEEIGGRALLRMVDRIRDDFAPDQPSDARN
ncbi:ACP S-malonyltransferase [Streptomyces sp. NPDC088560]|uniref:ACP S-malonyltransferase n=1 Tax=Streptomyces sp. NPDC088560 TaxID=3365868 RepID=UPI00380AEE8A